MFVEKCRKAAAGCCCCVCSCPDERLLLAERSALLLRRYFSSTVWGRLHVRPAASCVQLLFMCFQLLAAVAQLHSLAFAHCDLKTENLGLTSSLHLFLTDAAPWKDVVLRLRDMRVYSLLFESAKRSRCYLAPERYAPPASRSQLHAATSLHAAARSHLHAASSLHAAARSQLHAGSWLRAAGRSRLHAGSWLGAAARSPLHEGRMRRSAQKQQLQPQVLHLRFLRLREGPYA